MKYRFCILLIAVFAVITFLNKESSGGLHLGPVSAIRKKAKELKDKKAKATITETWQELTSPLSGVYEGKLRLVKLDPYEVTEDVIFQDAEIEVEAGTIFYMGSGNSIFINSVNKSCKLTISGKSGQEVKFTSTSKVGERKPEDWSRINIGENCDINIEYAVFEYGTDGLLIQSDAEIKNCLFRQNASNGIVIGDIKSEGKHTVTIRYCTFTENGKEDSSGIHRSGIKVRSSKSTVKIRYCEISGNYDNGIEVSDFEELTITDCNIMNNDLDEDTDERRQYDFYNGSTGEDINIPDIWWGRVSTSTIDAGIFDSSDDPKYSSVSFKPAAASTFTAVGVK